MATTVLTILDGWGYSTAQSFNAVYQAKTPTFDHLFAHHPHTFITASGESVGLPAGQMGNSEVGHINLGAGRIVNQQIMEINQSIASGEFFNKQKLAETFNHAKQNNCAVHVIGLLSDGGIHSHEKHMHAICQMAANYAISKLYIHVILDGRDTPPKSAKKYLFGLEAVLKELSIGKVVSIIGRFYAMDRDNRWDRIKAAYDLFINHTSKYQATSSIDALEQAYTRNETDEFVQATHIGSECGIAEQDYIIMLNFRSDRMRQLTHALYDTDFNDFDSRTAARKNIITFTEYQDDLKHLAIYHHHPIKNGLGEWIANQGMSQLRLAETEKYAHVTFFFNCGVEAEYHNENRYLIASPKVTTYDLQPSMSADAITNKLVDTIETDAYDLIVCNYANCDMVGHTGDMSAAISAVETLDHSIKRVIDALSIHNGQCIITADHGNAEKMYDSLTNQAHTAHTTNLVPMIYYGSQHIELKPSGRLCDVAPTLLKLMTLPQPVEMTGHPLY